MTIQDINAAIADLQGQLANAKDRGDTVSEIDALLAIASLCLDNDDPGGANMHYRLAEKVIQHSGLKKEGTGTYLILSLNIGRLLLSRLHEN